MTNEEKAREIGNICEGCFDVRKNLSCQFDCANKGKYYGALKMAEWKDEQFKKYLHEKMNMYYESYKHDLEICSSQAATYDTVSYKTIKELLRCLES